MLDQGKIPPLAELQQLRHNYSTEEWVDFEQVLRPLITFQEYPDLAVHLLSGIHLPPHERWIMYQMHRGAGSNVIVASRGTAKTSAVCVLYPTYCNVFFARRQAVTLAMTGFRGGQRIFKDIERWLEGGWFDQVHDVPFFLASVDKGSRPKPVSKASNQWTIEFTGKTSNTTVPTNTPENILGFRANDLLIDEAKLLEKDMIDNVAIPFLNVGTDFKHGGTFSESNRVTYCTTVDFTWRPFQERQEGAIDGLQREMKALEAAEVGNWRLYEELEAKGLHEHTYTQFDYTDLLVPREVTNREGVRYEVSWPNPDIQLTSDRRGVPFTHWDPETGKIVKDGPPVQYYRTYPIQKEILERGIRDGSADEASWKSEQRNILDTAVGDVYSNKLVDDASCHGDRWIIPYKTLALLEPWKRKYEEDESGYYGPVLWECSDPCVIGVDFAPLKDFCAFVVIRLGPLAEPVRKATDKDKGQLFDPFTHHGRTSWSNVIWAEQYLRMTAWEVAEKVRQLARRYNLVHHFDPHVKDSWDVCSGIGLDMRHGGSSVRDELAFINDEVPPPGPDGQPDRRVYDPFDKDQKFRELTVLDPKAIPSLNGIWATDGDNDRMVSHTIAQMEQGYLYLPKYLEFSERPTGRGEIHIGYEASRFLTRQLRKLRQQPTKQYRKFYMDGDTKQFENKKDLWAAFIYAAKQMRAHIHRQAQLDDTPPPTAGVVTHIGAERGRYNGRASGSK